MKKAMNDYFRPYRIAVIIVAVIAIIQAALQVLIVVSVKPVLREGINATDVNTIVPIGAMLIGLVAAYSLSAIIIARISTRVSVKIAQNVRKGLFEKIIDLDDPNDSGTDQSGLMTRLTSDVDMIQAAMNDFLRIGIYLPVLTIAVVICTWVLAPELGILMAIVSVFLFISMWLISKREVAVRNNIQQIFDRVIRGFKTLIMGMKTIRAFRRQEYEYDRFTENSKALGNALTDAGVKVSSYTPLPTLIVGIAISVTIVAITAVYKVMLFSFSNIVLFLQFIVLFVTCAGLVPFMIATVPSADASYHRIKDVMDTPAAKGPKYSMNEKIIVRRKKDDFDIMKGEEVSIIGRIGAGKSSFINSLMRFDTPDEGEIFFEGSDISTLDPTFVRSRIAYAGDRALTFRGTLFENIDVWRGNSKEKIEECCRMASMQDIDLEKTVWNNSNGLSSGERMKISIARALASDADLYIFDDCFNEMDAKTEADIVANIRKTLKGRTVIFASENVRIASGSDVIGFFENGRVIDHGTHSEMMASCSQYRDMKNSAEVFL